MCKHAYKGGLRVHGGIHVRTEPVQTRVRAYAHAR